MLGNICHIHITLFTFQFELLLKRTGLFNNTNMLNKKKKNMFTSHYLSINGNLREAVFFFCSCYFFFIIFFLGREREEK